MVKALWLSATATLLFASACSRVVDGCPEPMVREGDHCVSEDPSVPSEPQDDDRDEDLPTTTLAHPDSMAARADGGASEVPPDMFDTGLDARAPPSDASHNFDASVLVDAALHDVMGEEGLTPFDAQAGDVGADGIVGAAEDAATDAADAHASWPLDALIVGDASLDASDATSTDEASVDASDADAADAEKDGGDAAAPPLCSDGDLSNWRTFQISGRLVQTIAACYARDPRCATGACDLAACLRESAGVTGCFECVAEETRCALAACAASCGSSDTSDACRACACAQGCIGGTAACGMGPVNVCADCRGGTCNNVSLDPALIMVIVDTGS